MIVYSSLRDVALPDTRSCVALGLFDGLHPGHQSVIGAAVETARREGLTPCVFTFSIDQDHPAAKPTSGRLLSAATRNRLLAEMGVACMIRPPFEEFKHFTPEGYVHEMLHDLFRAKHLFCGENYHFGKGAAGSVVDLVRLGRERDIEVHTLPILLIDGDRVSSTRIRERIAAGDMVGARRLLSRPFSVDYEVVHGRRLGRTLDAPTINQILPEWFVKPRFGVYATVTTVAGSRYVSVTNVGMKPTVGSDHPLAETCILGYSGEELYGKEIPVEFYEFIRPEQKFSTLDELRAQIHADAETARRLCRDFL